MGMKTLRVDAEDEARLRRIRAKTGWTTSDVLKEGVRLLEEALSNAPTNGAFAVYSRLELGEGGYARGPASRSGETARDVIRRRHKRQK